MNEDARQPPPGTHSTSNAPDSDVYQHFVISHVAIGRRPASSEINQKQAPVGASFISAASVIDPAFFSVELHRVGRGRRVNAAQPSSRCRIGIGMAVMAVSWLRRRQSPLAVGGEDGNEALSPARQDRLRRLEMTKAAMPKSLLKSVLENVNVNVK